MLLSAILCIGLFLFLCGCAMRIVKDVRMPPHLRWELYPIGSGNEGSEGSYLEQYDWWTKPRRNNRVAELRFMAKEILLFHRCQVNNRGIWRFTLPFHWGLFLLTGWLVIQFVGIGSIFLLKGLGYSPHFVHRSVLLAAPLAVVGLILAAYGCTGLLLKRLFDPVLRSLTSRDGFFGLFLILATLLCSLLSCVLYDRSFAGATNYLNALIGFGALENANGFMIAGGVCLSVFLAYMPFTHMAHLFSKYFMYHKVLWQHEPLTSGSETERRIECLFDKPVGWSASHVRKGVSWRKNVSP